MGANDGTVIGITKLVDHGPASARWNMVILAEGYRMSELPQFHVDAQNFIDHLYTTAPFADLWCAVNVYRVDVASNQSGADDPATCGDGSTGSGTAVATYFDASFCGASCWATGTTRRLLTVDCNLALSVAHAQLSQTQVVMVLVNSPIYGGSGGPVATFSTHPQSAEIGIHEMGHTFFGFIDEYGDIYNQFPSNVEPSQPNATLDTNRATNKWRTLIQAMTPMPTTNNPNCTSEDNRPSPVSAGTVGTFEGAARAHCGAFRPEYNCRMRNLGQPFCAVCQQRIRTLLAQYMDPTTATLLTPSLSFANVPEGVGGTGVTTYRAITFEIEGCSPITLSLTGPPTGGFGTPNGLGAVVVPGETLTVARIWISYTSTTAGSSSTGTATVRAMETGQTWTINLSGNTVARPKSAVMLVLDRSGSMSTDAGNGHQRVELLRSAVGTFVDVMQQGDGLGIVRFDNLVDTLMPVTDVGPAPGGAGRTQAHAIVASHDPAATLDPRGSTSIGGGIQQAKTALDAAPATYVVRAMIVLTDGLENTPPMISQVTSSLTSLTFAIGFGQAASISTAALDAITQGHGGYLVVTGPITPDETFLLTEYFLKIQAGVDNSAAVLDPRGELVTGAAHRIPFLLTDADIGVDAVLLSPAPYLIDFRLETPDGRIVDPAAFGVEPAVSYVSTPRVSYYRCALPMLKEAAGSHGGRWHALLSLRKGDSRRRDPEAAAAVRRGLPYSLLVHAYSNIGFAPSLVQSGFEPGAEVAVNATVSEYEVPLERRATVWAEVTHPDGSGSTVAMPESDPGRFAGRFATSTVGVYRVRIRARGKTRENEPFARDQRLSAVVFPGDDHVPDSPGQSPLCDLLRCLLSGKVLDERAYQEASARGINLEALLECLTETCRAEEQASLGGEVPYRP